jgi:hypothetical protein
MMSLKVTFENSDIMLISRYLLDHRYEFSCEDQSENVEIINNTK